jgi:replicative DNA helicase
MLLATPHNPTRDRTAITSHHVTAPSWITGTIALETEQHKTLDGMRVLPHNLHAEQSLLGALMLENSTWDMIADKVCEDDFYRQEHRLIFRAMHILAESNQPFDAITLSDTLDKRKLLDQVGGLPYLAELDQQTASAANTVYYARIVRFNSVLRQLARAGLEITDLAFESAGRSEHELLDVAESKVFRIAEQLNRGTGFQVMRGVLARVVQRIDELYHSQEAITGLPTGFTDFDLKTSGLQAADLIIIAGRPSMGKTTFAMNIAENVAIKTGKGIAIFSLEMPCESLTMRMISSLGQIDQHRVRTGQLNEDDWPRLTGAVSMLADLPIYIDDTGNLSPTELRARVRRLQRDLRREEKELGLVVIDYLQLMQAAQSGENRTNEISMISRSLKALAKELHIPIIALSQLNRSLESRPNKRPLMSDLRECVTGDTPVLLSTGYQRPIAELVGTCPTVMTVNQAGQICYATAEAVWSTGHHPVLRIELANGQTLCATAEHRVLTDQGWCTVAHLQPNIGLARYNISTPQLHHDGKVCQPVCQHSWEPISAIVPFGITEVYDLTVPGPACWLSDGLVNHNSGAIEQDADVIAFIYRDEVYNENSTDKGSAEIIISKQRNGPIGTVKLAFLGQYTRFDNLADEQFHSQPGYY